jgi:hypothetical protein
VHPQVEQTSRVLLLTSKIAPQTRFRSGNANIEALSRFAFDAADAPMISFTVPIREKKWR